MKVLELLDELDEIMEVAGSVPLVKKVMVNPDEIREIVKEIRIELPDEIQQAQWIKNERSRILDEAKAEYEALLKQAMAKAESLVETDEITVKAKARAEEILRVAKEHSSIMKMSILDYTDGMLYNPGKMDRDVQHVLTDMYNDSEHLRQDQSEHLPAETK